MSDDQLIRARNDDDADLPEVDTGDVTPVAPPIPLDDDDGVVIVDDDDDSAGEVAFDAYDHDESVRLDVYNGLVHCIVSNTALWSTIDVAEVKHVVDDGIAALPHMPLALEPLWQYMLAKGAPRDAAASTILLFHSRAPRWNVEMVLPPGLATLSDAERAKWIAELRARGGTSGTAIVRVPTALHDEPVATKRKSKKNGSKRFGKKPKTPRKKIGMALRVLLMFASIVVVTQRIHATANEPRVARVLGSLCSNVELRGRAALCTASEDALDAPHAAKERAVVVDAALGVKVLFVDANGEVLPF